MAQEGSVDPIMPGLLTVVAPALMCHQRLQKQAQRQGRVEKPQLWRQVSLVWGRSLWHCRQPSQCLPGSSCRRLSVPDLSQHSSLAACSISGISSCRTTEAPCRPQVAKCCAMLAFVACAKLHSRARLRQTLTQQCRLRHAEHKADAH